MATEGRVQGSASRRARRHSPYRALTARIADALRSKLVRRSLGATLVAVCFLFLGYGVYSNWHELPGYAWHPNYRLLAAALLLYLGSFSLLVLGWHSVMRRIGGPWSIKENTEIYCFSNILRRVPPSAWFVAGRIYLYKGKGVAPMISSMGTFFEIVLIVTSGALVHLLFRPAAVVGVAPLTWLFLAIPPLGVAMTYLGGNHWRGLWARVLGRPDQGTSFSLGWSQIGRWLLLYTVAWFWGGTVFHCFAASLFGPAQIGLADSIGIWAASGVMGALPFFVPAGLGVREATLSFLLSFYVPLPVAIVVSGLFRIFTMTGETVCSALVLALIRCTGREQ